MLSAESRAAARSRAPRRELALPCGRWLCVRLLGRGRWTEVYQARPADCSPEHPADYVVKRLSDEFAGNAAARQSLARDVEVAKAVSHPNLAVVLAANLDAAPYYLTMPFLEGGTVRALVDRVAAAPRDVTGRPRFISVARCLWIARQTAEGLAQLHQSGWIHGDIKPTNLQVSPQGQTTILDFGLARRKETAECVSSDTWAGTVGYAAPETYLTHHTLTTAADIYSLGMVLYELLVGEPAFSEVDERRLIAAHLEQPLPDVLARRREIPPRLAHLLRRMTAKEPLRRPADDELLQELVALEVAALHAAA